MKAVMMCMAGLEINNGQAHYCDGRRAGIDRPNKKAR
jgi:hypothetical protein